MIWEDRSAFWREIAEHPEVKPHVGLGLEFDIAAFVQHPLVTPLRSEHGGFLFLQLDGLGRVYELHTLYHPDGWGKEVAKAAKGAFARMFHKAHLITTQEVAGWWRSRPPKSFGFVPAGPFEDTALGSLRSWILTVTAWDQSPARRRM